MRIALAMTTALLVATAAMAAEYTPAVLLQPEPTLVEGRNLDILGITTGMTPDAVRAWYSETYPDETFNEAVTSIQIRHEGISVATVPFVNGLYTKSRSGGHDDKEATEEFRFSFTGPASGNQLVQARRIVSFPSAANAPFIDDVVAGLLQKYGEPTERDDKFNGVDLEWRFKSGAPHVCQYGCMARDGYQIGAIPDMAADSLDNGDLLLSIRVTRLSTEQRVKQIRADLIDMSKTKLAANADMESILQEADRQLSEAPAGTPVQF